MEQQKCTCGAITNLVREVLPVHVGPTWSADVEQEYFRCTNEACGDEFFAPGQMEAGQRKAGEIYRREFDLLSADEFKAIRHRLRLTRDGMAARLNVKLKDILRWERGVVPHPPEVDKQIRALADNCHYRA